MDSSECEVIFPIKDIDYLQKLINENYIIKGQKRDPSRNVIVLRRFIRRGHEFVPENWLKSRGFEFVEPSHFTKGYKLAHKTKDEVLELYFESNYSLCKNNNEIHLYCKYEK
jgi:hypothetical protein